METNPSAIQHIVDRAREYNRNIGEYDLNVAPVVNYKKLTTLSVKLDNGVLDIPIRAMQYYVTQIEIPTETIQSIANSFRPFK